MEVGNIVIVVILAIGAVQGLVFSLILFRSTAHNGLANKILSAMLLLLSYRLLVQILRLFGLGYYDGWYYVMIDLSWVHGALLFFYTKAQIQPHLKFSKRHWIHFLPVVLQVIISVFVRLQTLYWDGT